MSLARLQQRVPNASVIGRYFLEGHDLRCHKAGQDGSAKCDAFYTGRGDRIYGVLFDIAISEKPVLDRAEGLGAGYDEKTVLLHNEQGHRVTALTYYALQIDPSLKPFGWYVNHLLIGAREANLPAAYIQRIMAFECVEDPDAGRHSRESSIHA